jgi:uncharacterized protein (TIGR03118 family)
VYGIIKHLIAGARKRLEMARQRREGGGTARRARPWLETLEVRLVPSANDWAMPNYSSAGTRDNIAEHTLSTSNVGDLHVLWNFPTAGAVAGTVAVVNNIAYAGDNTGMFYAVKSDGTLLWKTQVDGPVEVSALVTDDTVVFGTLNVATGANPHAGSIYGLDADTGAVKWKIQPNTSQRAAIWGSPTLVGKNVAIGVATGEEFINAPPVSRGSLVLLNPDNGKVIWQTYTVTDTEFANGVTGAAVWSTPAYDPKTHIIYAGTGNNYGVSDASPSNGTSDAMIAFDARDGHIIWVNQRTSGDHWDGRFPTGSPDFDFGDSPHLYTLPNGEKVVASGQKSGFFWVFDAKDGHVVNVQSNGKEGLQLVPGSTLGGFFATAAVDPKADMVFSNSRDPATTTKPATGHLFAIAGDGSHVVWQFDTPSPAQSGVAVANGVVYFETTGGILYALDEKTGALLAKIAANGNVSGPVVSNGHVYMGEGNLLGGNPNGPKGIVALGLSQTQQGVYVQTNLVSDVQGLAQLTDPNLKNPWGASSSAGSPLWVSNQATSTSTLYNVTATSVMINPLVVNIPTTPAGPQGPTGQVRNNTTSFVVTGTTSPASFIFADLNGTIDAWNATADTGGKSAVIETTTTGAVYTGLAIGSNSSGNFLYAANDAGTGSIDIFDGTFARVKPGTNGFGATPFVDPLLPRDLNLVPFNVQNIGGELYVEYAPSGRANQVNANEGDGAVAIFDTSGNFIRQVVAGSKLAAPWGVALAPATFGAFGGDLLVGNFAYNHSEINAFDPTTGAFAGTLTDANGNPILNQALWTIRFGIGGNNGDPNALYFLAGINGEKDGLFGEIQAAPTLDANAPIVPNLSKGVEQTFSTVPSTFPTAGNKDQNPYGVAFVPKDIKPGGVLQAGDILVSNFNNGDNLQGTGTTIVRINATTGERTVFFQGTGLGLTTALGALKSGFVIVGNVPTTDGKFDTIKAGSLLILDSNGKLVKTLADSKLLDGPWDLTINDEGKEAQVFVSNVLSGTVTRIDLRIPSTGAPVVEKMTQIASGYKHEANDEALVVGPTGLAYDAKRDILYVASTDDNAIYAIDNAGEAKRDHGKGSLIYKDNAHLHGPLGLVLAPNGDLITANGDAVNKDPNHPSTLVEFTTHGKFVGEFSIDKDTGGAFGIALSVSDGALRFAAVNDNTNNLDVWTFQALVRKHHGEDDREHKHHGDDQGDDHGDR